MGSKILTPTIQSVITDRYAALRTFLKDKDEANKIESLYTPEQLEEMNKLGEEVSVLTCFIKENGYGSNKCELCKRFYKLSDEIDNNIFLDIHFYIKNGKKIDTKFDKVFTNPHTNKRYSIDQLDTLQGYSFFKHGIPFDNLKQLCEGIKSKLKEEFKSIVIEKKKIEVLENKKIEFLNVEKVKPEDIIKEFKELFTKN